MVIKSTVFTSPGESPPANIPLVLLAPVAIAQRPSDKSPKSAAFPADSILKKSIAVLPLLPGPVYPQLVTPRPTLPSRFG